MSLGALQDARLTLGGRDALRGVSLAIGAGECVGLIGPNGAGKTSLMRAMLGLAAIEGEALLGGRPVAALSAKERARAAAYLPQGREVAWPITVEALVALGRLPARRLGAPPAARDRDAVEAALDILELGPLRLRRATELSGGELARVLIARALAQDAPLLLADEPAAGLDPEHALGVMEALRAASRAGRGVLVTLHDLGLAAGWCDRLVLLDRGRIAADDAPEAVLTAERLREAFHIEAHLLRVGGDLIVQPSRRTGR